MSRGPGRAEFRSFSIYTIYHRGACAMGLAMPNAAGALPRNQTRRTSACMEVTGVPVYLYDKEVVNRTTRRYVTVRTCCTRGNKLKAL